MGARYKWKINDAIDENVVPALQQMKTSCYIYRHMVSRPKSASCDTKIVSAWTIVLPSGRCDDLIEFFDAFSMSDMSNKAQATIVEKDSDTRSMGVPFFSQDIVPVLIR